MNKWNFTDWVEVRHAAMLLAGIDPDEWDDYRRGAYNYSKEQRELCYTIHEALEKAEGLNFDYDYEARAKIYSGFEPPKHEQKPKSKPARYSLQMVSGESVRAWGARKNLLLWGIPATAEPTATDEPTAEPEPTATTKPPPKTEAANRQIQARIATRRSAVRAAMDAILTIKPEWQDGIPYPRPTVAQFILDAAFSMNLEGNHPATIKKATITRIEDDIKLLGFSFKPGNSRSLPPIGKELINEFRKAGQEKQRKQ